MTLDEWMIAKKLKDPDVAHMSGYSRSYVSRLRRGKARPNAKGVVTFERITDLDVRLNDWGIK